MGTPLRTIIYEYGGGIRDNKKLKAVIPGGSSSPILAASEIDIPMDFDSLKKGGSIAGSGGIIVMDETTCIVEALHVVTRFYADESCGQCSPCREGTGWAAKILKRFMEGKAHREDTHELNRIAQNMLGRTICPLADAAALPIISYIQKFGDEFTYHAEYNKCTI
jgi:NADH-quinone oxidoreductase subunit F